jgi:hypothetical protein
VYLDLFFRKKEFESSGLNFCDPVQIKFGSGNSLYLVFWSLLVMVTGNESTNHLIIMGVFVMDDLVITEPLDFIIDDWLSRFNLRMSSAIYYIQRSER